MLYVIKNSLKKNSVFARLVQIFRELLSHVPLCTLLSQFVLNLTTRTNLEFFVLNSSNGRLVRRLQAEKMLMYLCT